MKIDNELLIIILYNYAMNRQSCLPVSGVFPPSCFLMPIFGLFPVLV